MGCSPVDSAKRRVGYRKMWLRIAKLGDLPTDITPHVLRHSFASLAADLGYNEPTIATMLGHKSHSINQQVRSFRRRRVAGSSRCRGECHHEVDGLGSSATPVAGSATRWSSRVGRNHRTIGVFVPRCAFRRIVNTNSS
jgi:integrase-like protein